MSDAVNHPSHYNFGTIEVIDVIEDWQLGFHLGNALKYIARAKHKGNEVQDLKKALWYVTRYYNKIPASDPPDLLATDFTIDSILINWKPDGNYYHLLLYLWAGDMENLKNSLDFQIVDLAVRNA